MKERTSVPLIISQITPSSNLSDTKNYFPFKCLNESFHLKKNVTKKALQCPLHLILFFFFSAEETRPVAYLVFTLAAARDIFPGAHHDTISANAD